jgi:hypothetical protein
MFNVKFGSYKDHDLVFLLNEDDEFWFVIRHTQSQNHVASVAYGEGSFAINNRHGGNVNAFIDQEVLPKATAKIQDFFGEAQPPVNPSDWREALKFFAQHGVEFKTSPSRVVRK